MIKLTAGVNFTNILRSVFMHADSKSVKNDNLLAFFSLLGSACVKASRILVGEINSRCQCQQHSTTGFVPVDLCCSYCHLTKSK